MSRIKILPADVAHKIAAGEVIERPASVVKELVENSVDAQATQISVEIKEGGSEFIRVQDNGIGIPQDQLELAFHPHATSKIQTAEDLFALFTLGFRGEALPSIASVSEMTLSSRPQGQEKGFQISREGTDFTVIPAGCPFGTIAEVRHLFFNLPARQKFLKSPAAERRRVVALTTGLALAHPHIALRLIAEGKTVLSTPGNGKLLDTILLLQGKNIASELIKFGTRFSWGELQGYIGTPGLAKGNRSGQFFIMNGRVIENNTVRAALEQSYRGLLSGRSFPWAVLNLSVNPELVDCNVHPAKAEVRFAHEQLLFSDVHSAVRSALASKNLAPSIQHRMTDTRKPAAPKRTVQAQLQWQPETWEHVDELLREYRPARRETASAQLSEERVFPEGSAGEASAQGLAETRQILLTARILGQLHQTYILLEAPDGLWLLDQHIVHEQILFETLKENWLQASLTIQEILPQVLEFGPEEAVLVGESLAKLKEFGLELEEFGSNAFLLRAIPSLLGGEQRGWKEEILQIAESARKLSSWQEEALISLACKGAIKAGEYLDEEVIRALLQDLARTKNPYTCPHGRPIIVRLENRELLRRFGRS